MVSGALTYTLGRQISDFALTYRFPSAHGFRESVASGGLISLGLDLVIMAAQAATYVDKIIRGAKVGDLPVEQPARYELHLNLKTAKALGLVIPPSVLARADQVIEYPLHATTRGLVASIRARHARPTPPRRAGLRRAPRRTRTPRPGHATRLA